jgi:phage terminase large subunit-like protein
VVQVLRYDGDYIVLDDDGKVNNSERFVSSQRTIFGIADGAASAKTSADFTSISAMLVSPRNDLVWMGCRREQIEIPDQPNVLEEEYHKHRMAWVGVEAVLSNVALYQHAKRTKMVVRKLDPEGKDKLARATPAIVFVESGRLWLPEPALATRIGFPLDAVLAELTAFTGDDKADEHDDIVDNLSYAVKCQQQGMGGSGGRGPGVWHPKGGQ